jgi:hypothetical protein
MDSVILIIINYALLLKPGQGFNKLLPNKIRTQAGNKTRPGENAIGKLYLEWKIKKGGVEPRLFRLLLKRCAEKQGASYIYYCCSASMVCAAPITLEST